jgi:hypothetical protein
LCGSQSNESEASLSLAKLPSCPPPLQRNNQEENAHAHKNDQTGTNSSDKPYKCAQPTLAVYLCGLAVSGFSSEINPNSYR